MRNFAIIILFLASVFHPSRVHALIDPARAAAIDVASELEKKALNAQYKVQMLQSTGHIWTRQEVDAVTDFQKEFNDYVSTFNSLLTYAAEIYGIYYDINSLANTLQWLGEEEQYLHEGIEVWCGRGDGCPTVHDEHQGQGYGGTADEDTGQNQAKAQRTGPRDQVALQVYPLYLLQ